MTTAVHPQVDWIRLTIGDNQIDLNPSPGIQLRLIVEPVPDDQPFGILDPPREPRLQVAVDLIPVGSTRQAWMKAVVECESQAARLATQLGADAPPLAPLKEFSLEAALVCEGVPYNRVSVPRLTLMPFESLLLDEDQQEPGVRVFTATARPGAGGSKYVLTQATRPAHDEAPRPSA